MLIDMNIFVCLATFIEVGSAATHNFKGWKLLTFVEFESKHVVIQLIFLFNFLFEERIKRL